MASRPVLEEAVYYRVKKLKGHKCALVCEADTVSKHIKSGIFIPFRRWFRKSMMISSRDPRASYYAKSLERLKIEESRHLERYYYMIHPFSEFHFYWQTLMAIVHLVILFILPIFCLTNIDEVVTNKLGMNLYLLILSVFCFINIWLSFFIGYYDKSTDKIILQPYRVIIRYMCTHFIFDLISTVNYNLISVFSGLFEPSWYFRMQWSFKLMRLFTINEYFDSAQLRMGLTSYLYRTSKYALFAIVIVLWLIFFNYCLAFYFQRDLIYLDLANKFFLATDNNLRLIFLCDIFKGYYNDIRAIDLYVAVATLHCGKFFEIWLLAQIFQIFASYMMVTHRYQTLLHQVKAFIRFKDLPKRMSRRIYSYLNFRFQYWVFNEKALIDSLCPTLKNEILWHICESLVTKVETFKELPPPVLIKLVTMIKPEIYLPNDVVVQAGEMGSEMFFIYVGVLAVFTESGKEICHLSDGTHFGEIALLLNEPRVASVVAIDFCELYRLTKKDFHEAIEPYPLVKAKIMKAAQDRFRETRIMLQK